MNKLIFIAILFPLVAQADVTIQNRERLIGEKILDVSSCLDTYSATHRAGPVSSDSRMAVERTYELYQVRVTDVGFFGAQTEELIQGTQYKMNRTEVVRFSFDNTMSCEYWAEVQRRQLSAEVD
ncbi:MAG TPA: hypothetical protein PKC28_02770 [Bdellovibrionales bacterium]|nr:hypothetical protein [Bdellovibrionales bacterium]